MTIGLQEDISDTRPITVTAKVSGVAVAQVSISGPKQIVTCSLASNDKAITSIELSAGPAALIELEICTWSKVDPWQQIPKKENIPEFEYPRCLPLTHPDYPCTPGVAENLGNARNLARDRILYGNPDQFTSEPKLLYSDGNVNVVHGSSIVLGQGTKWKSNLAGALLQVESDSTSYTILSVIGDNKLILSREYSGVSGSGKNYGIREEPHIGIFSQ